MAKLTSKASLVVGTNIVINEPARTIQLLEAGGLSFKDGVTLQAVYSKLVDLWATSGYQDSPFPMYAIDALSGQFQIGTDGANANGWTWADTNTRNSLRDGGWSETTGTSGAGTEVAQYCGFTGLGSVFPATTVQPYYHLASTDAPINFPFTDQFNIGVKVKDNVGLDKRTYAKCFVREYGKKFKSSILADTGATATGAFKQAFLISNEDDLKLTTLLGSVQATADAAMAGAPYSGITVAYNTVAVQRTIAGVARDFKIIIEGNGGTLEQIYAKVQYLLRQNSDINTGGTAGTKTGKIQDELLKIVQATHQTVFMITHDVDEAILLADKILLMSNGPLARIAEIVEVTMPRARTRAEIHHDPQYYRIRNHLVDFLVNRSRSYAGSAAVASVNPPIVRPGLPDGLAGLAAVPA